MEREAQKKVPEAGEKLKGPAPPKPTEETPVQLTLSGGVSPSPVGPKKTGEIKRDVFRE